MDSSRQTNTELLFNILYNKLSSKTGLKKDPWNIQVRFDETNSDPLSQVLNLLIPGKFFKFHGSDVSANFPILFANKIAKQDTESFQVIILQGSADKKLLKTFKQVPEIIKTSGINGNQEYSIFWIEKTDSVSLSENKSSNIPSQLTRPDIFPPTTRHNVPVPLWKVSFTSEAQYSASPLKANESMISDIIQKLKESGFSGKEVSFLDGTSNCGADAINSVLVSENLGYSFKILAVELNPLNYQALKENVSLFECEPNIEAVQEDVTKWLSNYPENGEFDCMYFDPPWGGKEYKTSEKIRLYLSGINIWKLCKEIMNKNAGGKLRLIVVKGPSNWDMNDPELENIKDHVKFKSFRNIVYAYILVKNT